MAVDIAQAAAMPLPASTSAPSTGRDSPNSVELSIDSHGRKSKSSGSKKPGDAASKAGSKSSARSSKKAAKSAKSQWDEDMAAMRHLRQIVERIAANDAVPQEERQQKIAELEKTFDRAEQRLHFKGGKGKTDPMGTLDAPTEATTEMDVPKKRKNWLRAARLLGRQKSQREARRNSLGALARLEEEMRGDMEMMRGQQPAEAREEAVPADDATATDSIIDLRNQNSEDYVASVCSLRSLGTFERDFVNNIIAEQEGMDDISVSTFEKDFMARQANGQVNAVPPTQVFVNADDISETTFEQDARSLDKNGLAAAAAASGAVGPVVARPPQLPMQVVTNSNGQEDDVDDDLTVGTFQSETTYERDQRLKSEQQKAPTTFAVFETLPNDGFGRTASTDSVSTFEKDTAALSRLAVKIGRTPSTKAKAMVPNTLATCSVGSEGTFEQDMGVRHQKKTGATTAMGLPANESDLSSTATFEKDMKVRNKPDKLSTINEAQSALSKALSKASSAKKRNVVATGMDVTLAQEQMMSPMSEPGVKSPASYHPSNLNNSGNNPGWFNDTASGAVEGDVSMAAPPTRRVGTGLSAAALAANAEAAAARKTATKISPLVVELSPNAIDRGVKSTQREGMWGKFLCHSGFRG
ncbi:hypothetical protein ACHAXT_012477 [Thalassiosira profunda]